MNPLRSTFLSVPRILFRPIPLNYLSKRIMSESKAFPSPQLPESLSSVSSSPAPSPKIHLYTAGTPNGFKVSILLEELLLAYPNNPEVQYDFYALSFANKDQKSEQFLKINPNGRIPALVDDNIKGGHNVFESISCMLWLVEQYDKDYKFWFSDPLLRSKAFSWIAFGQGGVGPMQGQANHFYRYAPEKIPYGIKRYQDETRRLYSVLEDGLNAGKGEWLVGDQYSIADLSIFGWVRSHAWAGLEDISEFPKLVAWKDRIEARKGTYNGLGVPERAKAKMTKEEEEAKAKEASKWVMEGQGK